jgi:OmcA/MtrC family decaheme c-type cytochrome
MTWLRRYWRAASIGLLVAASLASAPKATFGIHDKAYYADAQTVEFVRPGLTITVTSASIASNGTIAVNYTLTDPGGLPLDATGVYTPGTISLSYVAAVLPNGQEDYMTYTTRTATGTVIPTTQQPGADSGGAVTVTPTGYQYVFHTVAPSGFDATATHTIGIYGSRNLTVYNLGTNYASATYNFVPNGSTVAHTHDIIETASCNACHDQLSAHGGSRRGLNMCVLCHTPQNTDPNTGLTLDAKVFFHKLHMGASLPSVVAGGQYIPAMNSFGTFNYSTVVFPADPGDPRRCTVCHSQSNGAAQQTAYATNPSRTACGSCHDDVNFATGANHPGGIQNDDTLCANCHIPQGEMDFDASIAGAHVAPTASSLLSGLNVKITNVSGGSAGGTPTVTFTVLNTAGAAVPLTALSSISVTMAGPTTDYGYTSFGSNVTTPGYVTESMTGATCSASGTCMYTLTHAVPAKATGTYAVGIEARRSETVPQLIGGNTVQTAITYGAANPVSYFSVDGSPVASRRAVIAETNCNQCHVSLQLHGALRNNTDYCVFCHNPSNTDVSVRSTSKVAAYASAPPQGINFNLLVHRIHYGINQPSTRPYIVIGFGGSTNDFSGTLFPALSPTGAATDTENCSLCHVGSSEQNDLALSGLNPVTDPQGPINPVQAFTSACTGCHMDIATASHALSNTTVLGEACNVCHGTGGAYAVDQVHAQY